MNIVFLLVGFFFGFGVHYLYTNIKKKKVVKNKVEGGGGVGDPKPTTDNQTT